MILHAPTSSPEGILQHISHRDHRGPDVPTGIPLAAARPSSADGCVLLKNAHLLAGSRKVDRCAEPADAGANHQDGTATHGALPLGVE